VIALCFISGSLAVTLGGAVASEELRIGGVDLDRRSAHEGAANYLSGEGGFGYPAYDAFDAGAGPWRLSDGDLLAPALLNVTVRIPAFYALIAARVELEAWLAKVPTDQRLLDAGPDELSLLGELFAVLDDGLTGVRGTTLAKIMHRKRPAFVPLYDSNIWRSYVGATNAPVRQDRRRKWREFLPLLAGAMVEDLNREHDWLGEIAALAAGSVPVTTLRVLDIIAWQAGRTLDIPDDPSDHEPVADSTRL
jgi:hypothetical protein